MLDSNYDMNHINLQDVTKINLFDQVEETLTNKRFRIKSKDTQRPWGGFFAIHEEDAQNFIKTFFFEVNALDIYTSNKLSPKILLVEPGKRLSWQYHHRRAEIWKVIKGSVKVAVSATDAEAEPEIKNPGDIIMLKQGERHRLIGHQSWGIIAEIWQHTDEARPSDENDIIRLQDDFGR